MSGSAALRLATRGSLLARAQAALAAKALEVTTGRLVEYVVVETRGDRDHRVPVEELSGQGWFVSELEGVVADREADAAVHSAKDLPSELAAGLTIVAMLERGDPRDALVSRNGMTLRELPPGTRVGTSSPRRHALIRAVNPAVEVLAMRGNVDTRLHKVERGEVDAVVLAAVGLDRLGRGGDITERLDPAEFVPAPAQGVIAIEGRDDPASVELWTGADSARSETAVRAERAVLAGLGGGCLLPLGAWAEGDDTGRLRLRAVLANHGTLRYAERSGDADAADALGREVARELAAG